MKIGFFTNSYIPYSYGMGVSIEVFRKELEKLGHSVYVLAPHYPGHQDQNSKVIRFHSMKVFRNSEVRLGFSFLPRNSELKAVLNLNLDLIHAHSPFTFGFLGKYISHKQEIPLVYTHHTNFSEYTKAFFREEFFLPYLAESWGSMYSNLSDLVLAPSRKIKEVLKKYGVKKPIRVLSNGIDLNQFGPSSKNRKTLRQKLDISSETKILLYVGRLTREKNLKFLIQALGHLLFQRKDVILLMVGQGDYQKKLKKLVQKKNIGEFVKFVGKVPHSEISQYYQAADAFTFPSTIEAQGIVVLEAQACGTPPVVLKDKVFKGMIRDNQNGLIVKQKDPKIFARKISHLLKNRKNHHQLSQNALKSSQKFSQKNQAKKLVGIYKELTSTQ